MKSPKPYYPYFFTPIIHTFSLLFFRFWPLPFPYFFAEGFLKAWVRLAPWNRFKSPPVFFTDRSKAVLLLWIFYVFICLVFAMSLCASVYMCLVVTCWENADLLALVCGVLLWVCHFPIGILGQVWYLVVSIPDLCILTYFELINDHSFKFRITCLWAS